MIVNLVAAELARVHERIAGRFTRAKPRSGFGGIYLGWSRAWNAAARLRAGDPGGGCQPGGLSR